MNSKGKIKVLVVDDSLIFRETIAGGLAADPSIEVVGTAADAYEARDKIIELNPQVLTLDVEMPKMDGIEFLSKLMPQYPLPVVMLSSASGRVFEALQAGAVDFVTKPDLTNKKGIESLINELILKIKIASIAKLDHWKNQISSNSNISQVSGYSNTRVIAIGASTGGTEAIHQILQPLPKNTPGIVIVQHMPAVFTRMYAERLNNSCLMEVKEAQTGDEILPGRVILAPGNYQMKVGKQGNSYSVQCFPGQKVNGHCPSVDVLFESVAQHIGSKAIGVILTGMGNDGAKGLLAMRNKGARTIGQDELSCVVYGMPKAAFEIGAVEKQVPLEKIPQVIYSILNGRG